jgi:magnesium transporter
MAETRTRTLEGIIARGDWPALRDTLAEMAPPEIADALHELDRPLRGVVFRLLPRRLSSEVFAELEPDRRNEVLRGLTDEETRHLLAELPPDDRTHLFEELPGEVTQRLLNLLSPEDLQEARQLLGYPEESVGRLMTPDYVAVRPHWTTAQALEHIRATGKGRETVAVIYVTDASWRLLDALEIDRFILAPPDQLVEEIMDRTYQALSPYDDREKAVEMMRRYDLFALPVVDSDGVLLGIVTVDDVLDVAEAETTEDFHKGAAVAPLRVSYRESAVFSLYQRRIGWLGVLIVVNLLSSSIIAAFEETLEATIALAFFIPLLIDSGGNTGSQSATLMVRALGTGDVKLNQWARALGKELFVGAMLGISLGVASSALGIIRGGPEIGLVVGLAMAAIIFTANLIGTVLPFVLTRLRVDPAVASSPLITSIADAAGLLLYFSIATAILGS